MKELLLDDSARVLILAPHPDDESLACGGLIQHAISLGAAVRVLFVTDGDNNPWPQRVLERRLKIGPAQRAAWGTRRRGEALAAVRHLGLDATNTHFAGLPDGGLTDDLLSGRSAFMSVLRDEIDRFAATHIVGPSIRDSHADHNAMAVMIRFTIDGLPIAPDLLEYQIHGHAGGSDDSKYLVRLSPEQMEVKRLAINAHQTQVALSRGRFLSFAHRDEEFDSSRASESTHPVGDVTRGQTGWQIEVHGRRWFDRAFPSFLDIIACDGATITARRQVVLATIFGRARDPKVIDLADGSSIGRGHYDSEGRLILPDDTLPAAELLYLKRRGGILFFDEAGWKPVTVTLAESDRVPHGEDGLVVPAQHVS